MSAATAYADDLHVLGHVRSHKLDILAEGGPAWCAPHLRLHMVLQPDSPDVASQAALPGIMRKLARPISVDCPTAQDATLTVETGGQTLGSYQAAAAGAWAFTAVAPPAPAVAATAQPASQAPLRAPQPSEPSAKPAQPPGFLNVLPPPPSALGAAGPLDVRDAKQAAIGFIKAVDAGDMAAARAVSVGDEAAYARLQALCDRVRAEARLQASFKNRFPNWGYKASGFPDPENLDADTAQIVPNTSISNDVTVSVVQAATQRSNIKLSRAGGTWKVLLAESDLLEDPSVKQASADKDGAKFAAMMKLVPPNDALVAANANDIAQGIDAGLYTSAYEASQAYGLDSAVPAFSLVMTLSYPPPELAGEADQSVTSTATPEEAASLRAFVQRYQSALYNGDTDTIRALTADGSQGGALFLQAVVGYRNALFDLSRAFRLSLANETGKAAESAKLVHDFYLATFLIGSMRLSAPTGDVVPYPALAKRFVFSTSAPLLSRFLDVFSREYFDTVSKWRESRLLEVPPKAPVLGEAADRYFAAISIDQNVHFVRNQNDWKLSFVRQNNSLARASILQIRYGLFQIFQLSGAQDAEGAVPLLKDATSAITKLTDTIQNGVLSEPKDVFAALDRLGDDVDAAMKQGAIARNQSSVDRFLAGSHGPMTEGNPILGKWRDINDPGLEQYTGMAYNVEPDSISQNGGQNPAHFKIISRNQVEIFSDRPVTDLKAADGGQVCYFSDENHMFCPNFNFQGSGYYVRLGTNKQ
jgi:hypothetical protein